MRDIAKAVDMLPGSIYYHFSSKDELLVTVYEQGVRRISEKVDTAASAETDPWRRLEAASISTHCSTTVIMRRSSSVCCLTTPNP